MNNDVLTIYNEYLELNTELKRSDELALAFADGKIPAEEWAAFTAKRKELKDRLETLKKGFPFVGFMR
jgi:hypothetical protein